MKKSLFVCALFAMAVNFASAQQIPPNWDATPPRDTAEYKYCVGISTPQATEQEAVKNAWNDALRNFSSSIGTQVQSTSDISVESAGYSSGVEDAYTVYVESSSFSTQVKLTGVRELARKAERQGSAYIVKLLTVMSMEDFNRARQYVDNEEAAFLAYRSFAQKAPGLADPRSAGGYEDYYTWLRNACVTLAFTGKENQGAWLEQLERFIKKLYRNALVFPAVIDGNGSRIIYDSARYYAGVLRALQNFGLLTINRENSVLALAPVKPSALADFRAAVNAMKDSSIIFVTGVEVINTGAGQQVNAGNLVVNQFKALVSRNFNMRAVNYALPAELTAGPSLDEAAIIARIQKDAAFPARYAAICHAETGFDPGLAEYKIPPMVTAQARFTVYDVLTGETVNSSTVDTKGFVFSPANTGEQGVIAESRRALQFLYDPKNKPGLEGIMREALGGL
ncbi:MAG: hypothetical protein LBS57_03150 [Treponema sp.]|jgi:hypothetical protein|nr:hypothetical protein [Treponema sp.]